MHKKIATIINKWFNVFKAVRDCEKSVRVILEQHERGALLPDRVKELERELASVQEAIPELGELLETLTTEEPEISGPEGAMTRDEFEAAADAEPEAEPEDDLGPADESELHPDPEPEPEARGIVTWPKDEPEVERVDGEQEVAPEDD